MKLIEITIRKVGVGYSDPSVRIYCEAEEMAELHRLLTREGYYVSTCTEEFRDPLLMSCITKLTAAEVISKLNQIEAKRRKDDMELFHDALEREPLVNSL
jgi:hypothetical protein